MNETPQPLAPSVEHAKRPLDTPHGPVDLSGFGPLLSAADLSVIWNLDVSQIHRYARQGAFDLFRVDPVIGHRSYSKALIQRYLNGERLEPQASGKRFVTRRRVS